MQIIGCANRIALLALMLFALTTGCNEPLRKPQAKDWARRKLTGISLEAPYELKVNPSPLPGLESIAAYLPKPANAALDMRIDGMRIRDSDREISIDDFARRMFNSVHQQTANPSSPIEMSPVAIANGGDGRRYTNRTTYGMYVESLAIVKGKEYWIVEVYCKDNTLLSDAKRVLGSVQFH